jgi:hypothetical protein
VITGYINKPKLSTPNTDINFLTKMQKKEIRQNKISIAISEKQRCQNYVRCMYMPDITGLPDNGIRRRAAQLVIVRLHKDCIRFLSIHFVRRQLMKV